MKLSDTRLVGSPERTLEWPAFLDEAIPECLAEAGTSEAGARAVVRECSRAGARSGTGRRWLLARITYLATGALNRWLNENANQEENTPLCGVFAPVADSPRACAALAATALAAESGGRKAIRKSRLELTSPTIPDVDDAALPIWTTP